MAIKKIHTHKDMMVIGITGSYGKSSTKEFIAQVLGKKFAVAKTRGNQHTLSGIADVILTKITKKTQVFVVEMGAYGRGEIAEMCYVVKPNIGIVTGTNDQHLSLFRSLPESIAAKNELIDALPKNGTALFNGNDSAVLQLYKKAKVQKIVYGFEGRRTEVLEIAASDVRVAKAHITFTVHLKHRRFSVKVPLLGGHNITNLLPAIYIADYFGITHAEIKRILLHLSPLPNTMTRHVTEHGVTVIDDTFNSNPESIAAALTYMRIYKKKRFFVLQPMIELGRNAKEHHYAIGKELSEVCDTVCITNRNYITELQKGIRDGKGKCTVILGNTRKINTYLAAHAERGDIVLCEGSEAKAVVESLLKIGIIREIGGN
jgi:UDP-N-acetylmuramoyl-tripeptide--D-alanyl-D-alanine ligase